MLKSIREVSTADLPEMNSGEVSISFSLFFFHSGLLGFNTGGALPSKLASVLDSSRWTKSRVVYGASFLFCFCE